MKYIVLDKPTKEFLVLLGSLREAAGLTLQEVGLAVKIHFSAIRDYETGERFPTLPNLLKLVDYYGYDLSGSVNYKFYHGQITPAATKERIRRLGLSYIQVAVETGYSLKSIAQSVRQSKKGSLLCLNTVLEFLAREEGERAIESAKEVSVLRKPASSSR